MALRRLNDRLSRLTVDAQGFWNKRWGVSDPIANLDIDDQENPEAFISQTIDNSGFQFWVVFVAGIGFLTDAYDIFALNTIITIFKYLYIGQPADARSSSTFKSPFPHNWDTILLTATLSGIFLGMLIFGILGDVYGRRKMYGLELTVLIVGSVSSSMASRGELEQMSLIGWLVFWRVIMGIGIGADYPLSAVITSEFAPKRWRARMLATVFWMQPVGQLIVLAIAAIAIKASESKLQCNVDPNRIGGRSLLERCMEERMNGQDDINCVCAAQLDTAWRALVGVGGIPAAVALYFRMTIPPSPRFRMDVLGMAKTAVRDTKNYYRRPERQESGHVGEDARAGSVELTGLHQRNMSHPRNSAPMDESNSIHDDRISMDQRPRHSYDGGMSSIRSSSPSFDNEPDGEHGREYVRVSRDGFKRVCGEFKTYFWTQGNWRLLLGTAGAWLILDIPYYGLGLSFPNILNVIWPLKSENLDRALLDTLEHQLVITAIGAVVGGAICIVAIQSISPKKLQFWSFLILAVLLLVTGVAFQAIAAEGFSGLIVLYTIMQLFFQLGPNTTTYIISAELWPTKFRCTCHGISAAAGKVGAIVGQLIIANGFQLRDRKLITNDTLSANDKSFNDEIYKDSGDALKVFFGVMIVGAAITWFFVPDTRDPNGMSYSLTDLAKGLQMNEKLPEAKQEGSETTG